MATTDQLRKALTDAYPLSTPWKKKVKNMPDDQVAAIYLRLKAQGKIK